MVPIKSSEITPEPIYIARRSFIKALGLSAAGAFLAACAPKGSSGLVDGPTPDAQGALDDLGDPVNSFEAITNYNNYYEFSLDKTAVARVSQDFQTSPWSVEVGGMVRSPGVYDIEDLRTKFTQEERVYRLRCVEGWSMVIPWMGFPLKALLDQVEPTTDAKYVRFETVYRPE
ncbi:MAG: molybdopterin-dependent oxidoreductase, partial [Anaerolineales bacterium]|nr:molybdopterin-dependent oxidoreductase [Anaerolineales bacterium]